MQDFLCVTCGYEIFQGRGDEIFLEDRKWKKHYKTPGVLLMNPKELENKYFLRDIHQWTGLYRLSKCIRMLLYVP